MDLLEETKVEKTELTKEARDAKNEYMKQWRAKNKDRVRAINQRYWEKRAKEIKALGGDNSEQE